MTQEHISEGKFAPVAFQSLGEMTIGLQKGLIQANQRLSRLWVEQLQIEVAMWAMFVSDLASSKSHADIMKAYADHVSRHFKKSLEDGRHIFSDYQEIVRKVAKEDGKDMHAFREPDAEFDFGAGTHVTH